MFTLVVYPVLHVLRLLGGGVGEQHVLDLWWDILLEETAFANFSDSGSKMSTVLHK